MIDVAVDGIQILQFIRSQENSNIPTNAMSSNQYTNLEHQYWLCQMLYSSKVYNIKQRNLKSDEKHLTSIAPNHSFF